MSIPQSILITGASGYIGKGLAKQFAQAGAKLVLPLRLKPEQDLSVLRLELAQSWSVDPEQLELIAYNLSKEDPFAAIEFQGTHIIHCAADTRFNIEAQHADRVNRDASLSLFRKARSYSQLQKLVFVSTVYVSGEQTGLIPEAILPRPAAFVNHYERSKWETEWALAQEFGDLPWQIHRVATILADQDSGECSQINAVHNTLKLLYYGLISTIPGTADVPVYLVNGDFVRQAISSLLQSQATHEVYHICHAREQSLTLGSFVDLCYGFFQEDEGFRKRFLEKPILVDEESFRILSGAVSDFGSPVLKDALGSLSPFARQLFMAKDFHPQKLSNLYPWLSSPDWPQVLAACIKRLIQQRWKLSP